MNRRGSVLVLALWALMILTVFSMSISLGVQQRAALLSRLQTLDALYPLAYSGVEYSKSAIREDADKEMDYLGDSWAASMPAQAVSMANGSFTIGDGGRNGLVDEESKINLNKAKPDILARLLHQVTKLSKDDADQLAYCLIDWMDSDSFFGHPDFGAEDSTYESLDRPYSAKDAPYEILDEMRLVSGMTTAVYDAIKPYVTVYGEGAVNLNTASKPVRIALGFNAETSESMLKYLSGEDGRAGTGDDRYFGSVASIAEDMDKKAGVPLSGDQRSILDGLIAAGSVSVSSTVFSANVRATLEKSKAYMELDAVIDRKGKVRRVRSSGVIWPAR